MDERRNNVGYENLKDCELIREKRWNLGQEQIIDRHRQCNLGNWVSMEEEINMDVEYEHRNDSELIIEKRWKLCQKRILDGHTRHNSGNLVRMEEEICTYERRNDVKYVDRNECELVMEKRGKLCEKKL